MHFPLLKSYLCHAYIQCIASYVAIVHSDSTNSKYARPMTATYLCSEYQKAVDSLVLGPLLSIFTYFHFKI